MPAAGENSGQISHSDESTLTWTARVLGEEIASLGPPLAGREGRGVGVHLLEIAAEPPARAAQRQRLQLSLKYLITAWADQPAAAHDILGKLLFAAMQEPELEVESEPPSVSFWRAHGVPPQPCFVVRRRAWQELPAKPVSLVRKSVVETVGVHSLDGVVYGPGGVPLCDAVVHLPGLNRSTRTGRRGEFKFETVPAGGLGQLRIEARGRELAVDLSAASLPSPLEIYFEMEG